MSAFKEDLSKLRSEFLSRTQDVEPEELRNLIRDMVSDSDLKPAMLCFLASRFDDSGHEYGHGHRDTKAGTDTDTDEYVSDANPNPGVDINIQKCTGIQLVHTGLCSIREIVDDPSSWEGVGIEPVEEDMELLGADILVSMGLGLLEEDVPIGTRVINSFGSSQARKLGVKECEPEPEAEAERIIKEDTIEYRQAYVAAVRIGSNGEPDDELLDVAERLALREAETVSESESKSESESETPIDEEGRQTPAINGYLQDVIESGSLGIGTEAERGL